MLSLFAILFGFPGCSSSGDCHQLLSKLKFLNALNRAIGVVPNAVPIVKSGRLFVKQSTAEQHKLTPEAYPPEEFIANCVPFVTP